MGSDDRSARPGDLVLLVYLEREPRKQGCGSGRAEKGRRRSHEKGASRKLLREAPAKHHWAPLCWPLALGCRLLWGLVRAAAPGGSPSAGRGLAGKCTARRRQVYISRCGACRVRPARQASCSHFRSYESLRQTPSAGVSWEAACTGGNEGKGTGPLAARALPPVGRASRV